MENSEFARLLSETADLMEIAAEDGFRIRSYRNAAAAILGYPERVGDILSNPDLSGCSLVHRYPVVPSICDSSISGCTTPAGAFCNRPAFQPYPSN